MRAPWYPRRAWFEPHDWPQGSPQRKFVATWQDMDLAPVDWSDLILENFVTQAWSTDVGPLRLQGWLRSLAYTSTVCWVYKQHYYLPKLVDTLHPDEAYGLRWNFWTSSLVHGGNRPAKVTEGAPPCNRGWYDNHWGIQPTKLEGNNQSSWRYDRSVWKWIGYNKDGHKPIWGNYVQVFLGRRLNLLWSLEPSDFVHFLCVLMCLRQISKLLHAEKKETLDSTIWIWHCQVLSANKKE